MSRRRNRSKQSTITRAFVPITLSDERYMQLQIPVIPGATGYTIYGIAPIPVQLEADGKCVRVAPTADGYNLYEVNTNG